jgi:hypothetical protein
MMSTATTWTTEFDTAGQVVFPQRRNRLLVRLAIGVVLLGNSIWSNIEHIRDDDMSGALGVLRVTALAAFVYIVGLTLWQLITRRPVVTVDAAGIKAGLTKRSLGWHQISRIDDPAGMSPFTTVQLHTTDRLSRALHISKDNVLELTELSPWLRTLQARHLTHDT